MFFKSKEGANPGSNFFSFPGSWYTREESYQESLSWFCHIASPCQFSPPTWQLGSPFPTVVLWKDGKRTSVCCCFSSYWNKALKLKIEVRMEFFFSRCYVLPSHKTAWMWVVPRPSLPTRTETTVSLAASTILAPCFYTPGRNPSQEIHPALFLPTQPVPKSSAFIKMIWPPKASKKKAAWGLTRSTASHTCAKKPTLTRRLTHWCQA